MSEEGSLSRSNTQTCINTNNKRLRTAATEKVNGTFTCRSSTAHVRVLRYGTNEGEGGGMSF